MHDDPVPAVHEAARGAARDVDAPLLLAVSGGLDSMTLLHAMATVARGRIAAVATFDHGTGPAAIDAAAHVARTAGRLGLAVVVGRLDHATTPREGWEATWRRARHAFLAESAASLGARIATAHTESDQIETVLLRELRGAGARGLAGLLAPSPIVRPFVALRRPTLARYAGRRGIEWVDDPSNATPSSLRNRIRHDLLPALRRVAPGIDAALLDTGQAAGRWRRDLDRLLDDTLDIAIDSDGRLSVASAELSGYDRGLLAMVWGALAGRVGLALDRRGTHRLATFTMNVPRSGTIPLSGGWCLEARRDAYLLRRADAEPLLPARLPLKGSIEWGRFRFHAQVIPPAGREGATVWSAALPVSAVLTVRGWHAGDRLAPADGQPLRRVARYLSEAGLQGSDRNGWPVVVTEEDGAGDVVWIPGVRRADAATGRSGRPVRHYACERIAR